MLNFIRSVLNSIIIVIVIGLAAVFLLPRAFGYQPYMVVSASMQQTFPVGSLIFVRDITPEEVQVGDPVSFKSGTLTITHRVIAINRSDRVFTTKGDNNSASERIPFDSVRGKALDFCIPYIGYFAAWFITSSGRMTTLFIILAMAALSFILGRFSSMEEDEPDEEAGGSQPSSVSESASEETSVTQPTLETAGADVDYSEVINELNDILSGKSKEGESI